MALSKIPLQPGVYRENPSLSSEGFWHDCDKVRFKQGKPEKIGGWQSLTISPTIIGNARSMHTWRTNSGNIHTAIGTHKKLYILSETTISDITPIRESQALTNPFAASSGSTTVTVTDVGHGSEQGDYVTFSGCVHADLVDAEVNANHEMTYIDVDTYSIEVTTAATGSTTSGGSVTATYEIGIGNTSEVSAFGYGAGAWGAEEWGDARSATSVTLQARVWSFDNFGEDLVATHEGGGLYQWDSSVGVATRAAAITNAPSENELAVVTTPDRHLVSFGAHDGSAQDPMLVKWADQETLTTWTASAANTAGSQILSGGSKIVARVRSQGQTLIWTDAGLHAMQYIGPPYTFGFKELAQNCGAMGKNSVATVQSVNYWMGIDNFYVYDGAVRVLPCTVHGYIFDNIDNTAGDRVVAGANHKFSEIFWFYCEDGTENNNRYVVYNYAENLWYIGAMQRTAWEDSPILQYPRAINASGTIYNHEIGTDDDTSAMTAYIESSEFDMGDGDQLVFVKKIVPDCEITGNLDFYMRSRLYPQGPKANEVSQPIASDTTKLDTRVRGRSASIYLSSDALSDNWRIGDIRLDMRPDGKR
jgi:hypothetical protein